ncbi:MAG: DUF2325 domain-containing protein [Thermodesulfobacteriota bacterium]|nr:DUF2325 domain-containing protein [Thermodesulfobacteriota bacterium]
MIELEAENRKLHAELKKVSGKIRGYKERLYALRDQNKQLLLELNSQREMNERLKKETEDIAIQFSTLNKCDETCPSFDLCQKRILIVGGIVKIKDRYKKLIEKNGGKFDYHDGYVKGGTKGLKNQIRRADMVLCPVNCNSHNACLVTKKLGKKYSRPVHMLAGSGLSAISQAILKYKYPVDLKACRT